MNKLLLFIKNRKATFIASLLGLVCIAILYSYLIVFSTNHNQGNFIANTHVHKAGFFEEDLFYQGVTEISNGEIVNQEEKIRGAVIPHHYVASAIISDLFIRLAEQNPKTIVIIGPNHQEVGNYPLLTSTYNWETHFGILHSDERVIQDLIDSGLIFTDEDSMLNEHSTVGLFHFVKYYLPNTKIVPIIVKRYLSEQELKSFEIQLSKIAQNSDVVIIASIDFSHYLTTEDADSKDSETLTLMNNKDYQGILRLDESNIDSPVTLVSLMQVMGSIGINNFTILDHQNSGRLLHDTLNETTSYFEIVYSRK